MILHTFFVDVIDKYTLHFQGSVKKNYFHQNPFPFNFSENNKEINIKLNFKNNIYFSKILRRLYRNSKVIGFMQIPAHIINRVMGDSR